MKCLTSLKITDLKIHPKNDYYFDDVTGEKWERLLESIKNNGVRTPIIVTDNMVVVSGNQRVRACKELGISVINAEIEHYKSEDDVIRDLIEINIRQRGVIDDSEIKAGRRFEFLQRYYGVQQGGDRKSEDFKKSNPNNSVLKSQEQIAEESGISVDTMHNYIRLSQMIPEMQDLLDTGIVKPTTALAMIKQLPEEQQRELAEKFMEDGKKVPKGKVDEEIRRIKFELAEKDKRIEFLEQDSKEREDYIIELESREPEIKTVEVVKEVVPDDYEDLKEKVKLYRTQAKSAEDSRVASSEKYRKELKEANERIKDLENRKGLEELQRKLEEEADYFAIRTVDYIQKNGGYVWITERMEQLPEDKRKTFVKTIYAIDAFAKQMVANIGGYGIE